jgi:hypothetical protein
MHSVQLLPVEYESVGAGCTDSLGGRKQAPAQLADQARNEQSEPDI